MGEAYPVEMLFIIEKRRNVICYIQLIKELDQTAVYSVSDIKSAYEGTNILPRRIFMQCINAAEKALIMATLPAQ